MLRQEKPRRQQDEGSPELHFREGRGGNPLVALSFTKDQATTKQRHLPDRFQGNFCKPPACSFKMLLDLFKCLFKMHGVLNHALWDFQCHCTWCVVWHAGEAFCGVLLTRPRRATPVSWGYRYVCGVCCNTNDQANSVCAFSSQSSPVSFPLLSS